MNRSAHDPRERGEHRKNPAEMAGDRRTAAHADSPVVAPSDTVQGAEDAAERRRHARSENALKSSQDKNPIPPGSTRK